jgi:hypothetical protein
MDVNLACSPPTLSFSGLAGGASRETVLAQGQEYYGFVSLYNRGAAFTLLDFQSD